MRPFKRLILLLLVLLTLTATVHASGISWSWSVQPSGFFLRLSSAGANDGWLYRRVWCNGHWQYRPYQRTNYVTATSYGEEGWRSQLVAIAGERERYAAKAKASALEHSEFLDTVRELGLTGKDLYSVNYSQATGMPSPYGPQGYYQQQYAEQGNTQYGLREYTQTQVNGVDLSVLYNQAERLASQAQQLAGQATGDFSDLTQAQSSAQARVAEIIAQGQVASELLRQAKPAPADPSFRTYSIREQLNSSGSVSATGGRDRVAAGIQVAATKCAACHNPETQNAGLDIATLQTWQQGQKDFWRDKIQNAVTRNEKRMPLGPNHEEGVPLTVTERNDLLLALE